MENIVETTTPVTEPAQDATPETTTTPSRNDLSFTVIHGYLRGEHAKPFELHATGCRDLRSKQAQKLYSYEVLAPTPEDAVAQAVDDMQGTTVAASYHVQPCTLLKRMKAIGRA